MKRCFKSWAVFLASLLLMATILPLVSFRDVRADESDYSVSWRSGGADAFKKFTDDDIDVDYRLFLNVEKLICEFKTGGEVMNLKYQTTYKYGSEFHWIEESDVVMNTTTLKCVFEPECGDYCVNDKVASGMYSFNIISVDSKGNEALIYTATASVMNTTNGIESDCKLYAIESNSSGELCTSLIDTTMMINVKGFQLAFEIEQANVIVPYTYEIKYKDQVLYTSPEYISSINNSAIAEYSSQVSSLIPLESNGLLKEGRYRVILHLFDPKYSSCTVNVDVANTDCPPETTLTFKNPDDYDPNTNTTYFREPSEIKFDVTVDSNGFSYYSYSIYKDGQRLCYPSILNIGTTNVTLDKRFTSDIFNSDGTLNYGDYDLVIESIWGNELAKAPFTVLRKNQPIPTPTPTPKPTATPTKAPGTTSTPAPTVKPGSPATPTKVPGATSAPKPTSAPGAKPTTTPSNPSNPSVPSDNGVGGFIDRLYTVALGRDFDEGGKNYWTNEIKVNGQTGADIARQFLYSEEFLGKNMSQDDFLTVLYRTFFDREPDASGLKYWKDQMSAGQTKEWVIAGFINSEEWANICLSFGIRSGSSVAPTITITPNENVIGFATRLYTTCLKREYDPEGLDFWAKELANLRRTGSEAAKGFFFSDEINKSGISDSEFLTRLYKTLMNREPEKDGFDYWLGQMKSGAMSRESVFDGFAASEEWVGICADYGILR